MAKMFQWRKPEGNPPTNGYDVSRRDTYTTVPGILNCIRPRVVGPKSKFRVNLADCIFNSLPTINQPFNRGSFYVDFYQVPMTQIMHRFDDFYTQLAEKFSSQGLSTQNDELDLPALPHIDLWSLTSLIVIDLKTYFDTIRSYDADSKKYLWYQGDTSRFKSSIFEPDSALGVDVHGYPAAFGLMRLLDMMNYGNWYMFIKEFFLLSGVKSTDDYSKVLSVYFQKVFDEIISGEDTTEDYADAVSDFISDVSSAGAINSTFAQAIVLGGLNEHNLDGFGVGASPALLANMLDLYAYQKVFSDIYRNSFYDSVSPFAYSADWFVEKGLENNAFEFFRVLHLNSGNAIRAYNKLAYTVFEIRYRQFKNDMFTSLLPNSQFGDVSMVNVGDSVFNLNVLNPDSSDPMNLTVATDGKVKMSPNSVVPNFQSPNLTFTVLMQRRAEALQKYKERYLRAGNRLRDQYVSEFGKVPYYLDDKYCRYLGSMSSALKIQGVPATADTGDYNVGERAGYGYSGIDGSIEFSVDDWSIIVPIMYYLPETDYEAFGLGAENKFSEFTDYYVPEFENLGLEPVYRTTLSLLATLVDGGEHEVGGERVIGYGPAYMYFKTDVDKVHGEFGDTGYLSGVFSSWVTTRGNVSMSELSDYYVRPDFCNSIMKQQYNGSQHTDQFLCCLGFDWKAIQPLSVVGLPIWE